MFECAICCEEREVAAVGACGHADVCLECCFKLRSLGNDRRCAICKETLAEVLALASPVDAVAALFAAPRTAFCHGIAFCDERGQRACERLARFRCAVSECARPPFDSVNALRRHLREQHRRFFCDLCLESRALLPDQQRIYREEELQRHCDRGDFDADGNLVLRHPFCAFCERRFFDEETFLAHMRAEHLRCDFCHGAAQRHTFYKQYANLQTHFSLSHYACPRSECVARGFVAFETREQLERHAATHGERAAARAEPLFQPPTAAAPVDREGLDVSDQLLSLWKAAPAAERALGAEIDRLELMELLFEARPPVEDELAILKAHKERRHSPKVCFEDVQFARGETRQRISFSVFKSKLAALLSTEHENALCEATNNFDNGKLSAAQLFDRFAATFGPILSFKYFHFYATTLNDSTSPNKCIAELQRRLGALPFREKSIVSGVSTWSQLFKALSACVALNVQRRIAAGTLPLTRAHRFNKMRLFQLVHSVRALTPREATRFTFLANFLREAAAKTRLGRAAFAAENEAQKQLDGVGNTDILVLFLYLNIVELLLEGRAQFGRETGFNPNLLRLFFRHYPALAARYNYSTLSEAEDYDEPSDSQPRPNVAKPVAAVPLSMGEKVAVFTSKTGQSVFESNYDFPALESRPQRPAAAPQRTGWGSDVTVVYANERQKRQAYEEEFPTLQASAAPVQRPTQQPVRVQAQGGQSAPGQRNLLGAITATSAAIPIVKVKRKKKG